VREPPLGDLLEQEDPDLGVAGIAGDRDEQIADLVAAALEDLDEQVVADAQRGR
jgi:hypothetical protein